MGLLIVAVVVTLALAVESLGPLFDPPQHFPFHEERARLQRQHADARSERREAEAVAADQPRAAVIVFVQHERPDPVAVLGAPGEHVSGLEAFEAHSVRAVPDRFADLGMLVLRQDVVGAVHVEAEQVLDPVVGVGAAARRRTHLREPRPDRYGWRINRDRACGDTICVLE
jgi:hypothetical protein